MSELKAFNMPRYAGVLTTHEVYLKSEADKVIAEKDKEIAELKGQVNGFQNRSNLWHYNAVEEHKKFVQADLKITKLKEKHKTEVKDLLCLIRDKENNFNRAFDSEEKELRHHKYKRCLAMAWWCESEEKRLEAISPFFDTDRECWEYNSNYWVRWCKRWLAIAEKFKPNSTAQQGKG